MSKEVQTEVFGIFANKVSCSFPSDSLSIKYADAEVIQQLELLRTENKIKWEPSLKAQPFFDLDNKHPIRLSVFYRDQPVGYAFGAFSCSHKAVEVKWMEKRNDAHPDLSHKMLNLVVGAYAFYAAYLKKNGNEVDKLALVNPIEDLKQYYLDSGFFYRADYDGCVSAMIADLVKSED